MAKARMRVAPSDEVFGPMAVYQGLLAQTEKWVSYSKDAPEEKRIEDMVPAYAVNALHRLARWMEHLFRGATAAKYEEERTKLLASPLAGALVEQALGPFYTGTYLQAHVISTPFEEPHLDEVLEAGRRAIAYGSLEEQLLDASIDGVVALQSLSSTATTGQQARTLYTVLATTITLPEAP